MFCKKCQTNTPDDDIRNCPVCDTALYGPAAGMKPSDYDPAEDADAPIEAYVRAKVEVLDYDNAPVYVSTKEKKVKAKCKGKPKK